MSLQYPIQKRQFLQPIAAVLLWLKWLLSGQLFRLLQQVLSVLVQNQTVVRTGELSVDLGNSPFEIEISEITLQK